MFVDSIALFNVHKVLYAKIPVVEDSTYESFRVHVVQSHKSRVLPCQSVASCSSNLDERNDSVDSDAIRDMNTTEYSQSGFSTHYDNTL